MVSTATYLRNFGAFVFLKYDQILFFMSLFFEPVAKF